MNRNCLSVLTAALLLPGIAAFAASVRTDYDHSANFANYKTYSWGAVTTANPLNEARVKAAVDADLQADGWQLMPLGGAATIIATGTVKNEQELETMYDGMGGGYGLGGGWGWGGGWGGGFGGGYGAGGFGEATTTTQNQRVGHLVVDIFTTSDHKLLFRGVADNDLGQNSSKNTKNLNKDVADILKKLPKSAKS